MEGSSTGTSGRSNTGSGVDRMRASMENIANRSQGIAMKSTVTPWSHGCNLMERPGHVEQGLIGV